MKSKSIIGEKSYEFAIRVVNFYKYLGNEKKEFILSKQVLRSGTSIGANVQEGLGAFSRKEFIHKMQLSYKESRETIYWIKLLRDTKYITKKQAEDLLDDATEISKILTSILKTTKKV